MLAQIQYFLATICVLTVHQILYLQWKWRFSIRTFTACLWSLLYRLAMWCKLTAFTLQKH